MIIAILGCIIVMGEFSLSSFVRSGICRALDGITSDDELDLLEEMDPASDTSTTSSLSNDEEDYQSSEADDKCLIGVFNEASY